MNYLQTFFDDEGMPYLGDALANSQREVALFDVTRDLKMPLKPDIYQRLIGHSFAYALPYYPLHQFGEQSVKRPLTCMILMDWEGAATTEGFTKFMKKNYRDKDLPDILAAIDKYIKKLTAF